METWTFYNKSVIIFYGTLQLILFPHVSEIYITVASLRKSSVLCSAGRGAAACQLLSASYINNKKKKNINEGPIYRSSFLSSSVSHPFPLSVTLFQQLSLLPPALCYLLWCCSAKGKTATNGLGKPITRPSPLQETESSHQLVAICSHTSFIKVLFRGRDSKPK